MKFTTINPATEQIIADYQTMPPSEVTAHARQALAAFAAWRDTPLPHRADLLHQLAAALRQNADRYARIITTEMGKPIVQSRSEVEKCAWAADVFADHAAAWLQEETVAADGKLHRVCFEPIGVILGIMPWNFPFWQAFRFGIPALLVGNTALLKHANNVTQCAFAIEEAFTQAGFPDHVFRTILADHDTVADLIASDLIAGVSLTGSTRAGQTVGATAGAALKKVVLELGGSDPFIVLDDADLAFTARNALTGRMLNAGQSCIAAKRFIVAQAILPDFARAFADLAQRMVLGDPLDEATQMGPLVSQPALEELDAQVQDAVRKGAKVLTGGSRLDRKGYFYRPTILTDVTPDMRCFTEEVFGPVAVLLPARNDEHALQLANTTPFGLGASIWTRDLDRAARLARRLEAGAVFVNSIVKSDPRLPFGGVKKSGIGRELSPYGLREFANIKTINIYEHK